MTLVVMTAFGLLALPDGATAQDAETQRLREQVAALEAKLASLQKENELLKREVELLKKEAAPKPAAAANPSDAFAVGATLKGIRYFAGMKHTVQDMTLVVAKRDGTRFEGEATFVSRKDGSTRVAKVTGSAPVGNGVVQFATEKSGLFQHKFTDRLNNGEVGFAWSGTAHDGNPVSGRGSISK